MIKLKQFRDDENSEADEKWIPELISAEKERKQKYELKRAARLKNPDIFIDGVING